MRVYMSPMPMMRPFHKAVHRCLPTDHWPRESRTLSPSLRMFPRYRIAARVSRRRVVLAARADARDGGGR